MPSRQSAHKVSNRSSRCRLYAMITDVASACPGGTPGVAGRARQAGPAHRQPKPRAMRSAGLLTGRCRPFGVSYLPHPPPGGGGGWCPAHPTLLPGPPPASAKAGPAVAPVSSATVAITTAIFRFMASPSEAEPDLYPLGGFSLRR
jgi:hypothetical protein